MSLPSTLHRYLIIKNPERNIIFILTGLFSNSENSLELKFFSAFLLFKFHLLSFMLCPLQPLLSFHKSSHFPWPTSYFSFSQPFPLPLHMFLHSHSLYRCRGTGFYSTVSPATKWVSGPFSSAELHLSLASLFHSIIKEARELGHSLQKLLSAVCSLSLLKRNSEKSK